MSQKTFVCDDCGLKFSYADISVNEVSTCKQCSDEELVEKMTTWFVFDCETGGTIYSGLTQDKAQELSFNYPSWCAGWETIDKITPAIKIVTKEYSDEI